MRLVFENENSISQKFKNGFSKKINELSHSCYFHEKLKYPTTTGDLKINLLLQKIGSPKNIEITGSLAKQNSLVDCIRSSFGKGYSLFNPEKNTNLKFRIDFDGELHSSEKDRYLSLLEKGKVALSDLL